MAKKKRKKKNTFWRRLFRNLLRLIGVLIVAGAAVTGFLYVTKLGPFHVEKEFNFTLSDEDYSNQVIRASVDDKEYISFLYPVTENNEIEFLEVSKKPKNVLLSLPEDVTTIEACEAFIQTLPENYNVVCYEGRSQAAASVPFDDICANSQGCEVKKADKAHKENTIYHLTEEISSESNLNTLKEKFFVDIEELHEYLLFAKNSGYQSNPNYYIDKLKDSYGELVQVEQFTNKEYAAMLEEEAITDVVSEDGAIGSVYVKYDNLNIRSGPDITSISIGKANEGASYKVYEIEENEYTWYRIRFSSDREGWIPTDGEWVDFSKEIPKDLEASGIVMKDSIDSTYRDRIAYISEYCYYVGITNPKYEGEIKTRYFRQFDSIFKFSYDENGNLFVNRDYVEGGVLKGPVNTILPGINQTSLNYDQYDIEPSFDNGTDWQINWKGDCSVTIHPVFNLPYDNVLLYETLPDNKLGKVQMILLRVTTYEEAQKMIGKDMTFEEKSGINQNGYIN